MTKDSKKQIILHFFGGLGISSYLCMSNDVLQIKTQIMTHSIAIIILTITLLAAPVRVSAGKTVTVSAGNLQSLFDTYDLTYERDLTLEGTINGSDVRVLRKWANSQRTLNLSDCRIVAGGDPYYEDYTTEDDVIGPYMFADKEFKSLVLPNTLKKIGDYALTFCGDSLVFPPTLTWIGDHAITKNLFKRLHIPATLVHIGNGALNGNISLEDVTIDEGNPEFVLEDGYLYTRDHTRLLSYFGPIGTRAESFTIRPEVKIIDDKAFNYHRSYNITLNEQVEYIGEEAFKYVLYNMAPHQKKLVIPNSVTYIGASAFENCYIDKVIISDNVEYLRNNTFAYCFIDDIHLPAKLKHIGRAALNNNRMRNLVLPDGLETMEEYALYGLTKGSLVIPESLRHIDEFAFSGIFVDTINILPPLDSIPKAAFYSSQSLVKLILPPTVKRIGQSAFYECYRLKNCQLPDGLEEIGPWALAGADYMKEWHIPASVRKIEWAAFAVPNFSSHTVYMYSQEPPAETDPQAFKDWTMKQSVLYVPKGCIENYQQAPWNTFGEIREFEPTSVKSIPSASDDMEQRSFDLGGRPVSDSHHGLRIVMTPNGTKKVVK